MVDALDLGSSVLRRESSSLSVRTKYLVNQPLGNRMTVKDIKHYECDLKEDALSRELTLTIPANRVKDKVDHEFKTIGRKAQLPGFRPGKVPMSVLRSRYEGSVLADVINQMIEDTMKDVFAQHQFDSVDTPKVSMDQYEANKDVVFKATFEVFPKVDLSPLKEKVLEEKTVSLTDEDISEELAELKEQHPTWKSVKRAAKNKDRVSIDYTGYIDDEVFEGGQAEKYEYVVGSAGLLKEIDESLVGKKATDAYSVDVVFPEEYHAKHLAGKSAKFAILVHEVCSPKAPAMDETFFKAAGAKATDEKAFLEELKQSKEKEVGYLLARVKKDQCFDFLKKHFTFDVPQAMLEEETKRLGDAKDAAKTAADNVRSSIVMRSIIQDNNIKLDEKRLDAYLRDMCMPNIDEEMFVNWYRSDKARMNQVQGVVLEQQVIDWIYTEAKTKKKAISLKELTELIEKAEA